MNRYPGAEHIIRITIEAVFSNCPRYIHKMQLVEESQFVPTGDGRTGRFRRGNSWRGGRCLPDEDKKHAGTDTDLNNSLNKD
jgi:hypothetical protein